MANLSGTERRALADALKHQQLADAIADTIDNVEDLTTTELGYLDGITPGTAAANKAVILGASSQIDAMTITTLTTTTANATNIDAGASGTAGTIDSDVGDTGEATIIASTAMPQASGGTTTAKAVSASAVVLDGTTTAADLILNFLIDDADITALDTLSLSGSVTITWINLGDT